MKRYIFSWVIAILYFLALPGVNFYKFDTICCFTVGWACGYVFYPDTRKAYRYVVRKIKERRCA